MSLGRACRDGKANISYPRRLPQPPIETLLSLGPLASLAGRWVGTGFNVIWRPDNTGDPNFAVRRFLQLNRTAETLDFDIIPSPVPNRGLANQKDITIYGLNYLQKIRDDDTDIAGFPNAGEDLHIEPGLFLNVPQSGGVPDANNAALTVPVAPASIVRLATIPHGVTVLLQGDTPSTTPLPGAPHIPPIYPVSEIAEVYAKFPHFNPAQGSEFKSDYENFRVSQPAQRGLGIQPANVPAQALDNTKLSPPQPSTFHAVPENTLSNDQPYPNPHNAQSNGPFPAEWQHYVDDPNVLLRDATRNQELLGHIRIRLATPSQKAIGQIPFLGGFDPALEPTNTDSRAGRSNAFVHSVTSTFWIEWVRTEAPYHAPPYDYNDQALKAIDPFPGIPKFLQLQYSQTVILNFNQVLWPHVSVATLRLHM